jgi:hypothetical protein
VLVKRGRTISLEEQEMLDCSRLVLRRCGLVRERLVKR